MLCLSRKTEYALVALAHLAEHAGTVASAREIAQGHRLPLPMVMSLLKNLQAHDLLRSTRGVKGGYELRTDLSTLSLYDLIAIVECSGRGLPEGPGGDCGCMSHAADLSLDQHVVRFAHSHGPVQALQFKLVDFLKGIAVADLVQPGRRIDVPSQRLRLTLKRSPNGLTNTTSS